MGQLHRGWGTGQVGAGGNVSGQRLPQRRKVLGEVFRRLLLRHVKDLVAFLVHAHPRHSEVETPPAQDIERQRLLGYGDRVVEWQHAGGQAEPDAARACCQPAQDNWRCWAEEVAVGEVPFGEPCAVETELLGLDDLLQQVKIASILCSHDEQGNARMGGGERVFSSHENLRVLPALPFYTAGGEKGTKHTMGACTTGGWEA